MSSAQHTAVKHTRVT